MCFNVLSKIEKLSEKLDDKKNMFNIKAPVMDRIENQIDKDTMKENPFNSWKKREIDYINNSMKECALTKFISLSNSLNDTSSIQRINNAIDYFQKNLIDPLKSGSEGSTGYSLDEEKTKLKSLQSKFVKLTTSCRGTDKENLYHTLSASVTVRLRGVK